MIINLRTNDDLHVLLAAGQSGDWIIARAKEIEAARRNAVVKIYDWDGTQVLIGDFDPASSYRLPNGTLVIGFANGRIEHCNIYWPWQASRIYTENIEILNHTGVKVGIVRALPTTISIDEFFKRLMKEIIKEGITRIVFCGGGTIPIPDWFREFCKQNGIQIEIIDEDEMNRQY